MGTRFATAITSRVGALVVLLVAVGLSALAFVTSPEQPAAGPADGLPSGKQSTRVTELLDRFPSGRTDSAVVVYERGDAPLTADDRTAIDAARERLAVRAEGGRLVPTVFSDDRQAALVVVPLSGDLSDDQVVEVVDGVRADVRPAEALPAGLNAQVTGGAAFSRDISAAFDGADVTLLAATAAVVALLLLVTYRSPLLWIVPLVVIGVGDQVVARLMPWVARLVGERTDAAVSGIVSVLVFGAGTDYALLLISRYREELRRTPDRRLAMARALRGAAPAVIGSAGTVVLALLTLLFALLTGNRTLGVAGAIGVAVALVFGLVVLPAALASLPRGLFWPFVPRAGSPDAADSGLWARVAGLVGRRPAAVLVVSVVLLGVLATGLTGIRIGLSQTEQFRTEVESVTAQEALARHFPAGSAQPAVVIAPAAAADRVLTTLRDADGVAAVGPPERSDDGRLVQLSVQLTAETGSAAADRAVTGIRDDLAGVDRQALLGGPAAADLDRRDANLRDNLVIAPLILGVVLLVLVLLLRSIVAPLLLVLTVVASYAASLGAATFLLRTVFDLPALDASVPLLGFLFLVALGVDYNIFLVTRAREEAAGAGTRAGMLRALTVTGGVITSAGVLLAAVFAVLGVLPVIVLTQVGVLVGVGVLLDTLLVRTLVVPALALLLGDRFWWPARTEQPVRPAVASGDERVPVPG